MVNGLKDIVNKGVASLGLLGVLAASEGCVAVTTPSEALGVMFNPLGYQKTEIVAVQGGYVEKKQYALGGVTSTKYVQTTPIDYNGDGIINLWDMEHTVSNDFGQPVWTWNPQSQQYNGIGYTPGTLKGGAPKPNSPNEFLNK
ncbi:MAG: hypothetical protein AABW73_02925 [Nanoarchaeota archaeon]